MASALFEQGESVILIAINKSLPQDYFGTLEEFKHQESLITCTFSYRSTAQCIDRLFVRSLETHTLQPTFHIVIDHSKKQQCS